MDRRSAVVLLSTISILIATVAVIIFASGYRPNFTTKTLEPTGILVATSDPDGAAVTVEAGHAPPLLTATNTTLNLTPDSYDVRITKDGFWDWQKRVDIKKEEVYKTNAFLFPKAPDLRPLTFNGVTQLFPSPNGIKLAYSVATGSAISRGLWIFEMTGLPLVSSGNSRLISKSGLKPTAWSFDERQIVASNSAGVYFLLETDRINDSPDMISVTQFRDLLADWQDQKDQKVRSQLGKLDRRLLSTLATSAADFKFSPDETKVLFSATASAILPIVLTTYLPGTNPTSDIRDLTSGKYYVYDLKEDKNYFISNFKFQISNLSWFSTSRHLVINEGKQISIMEYDGTNKATIYAGPFIDNFVFPWPGSTKIIILTSLNPASGVGENLYTINLR